MSDRFLAFFSSFRDGFPLEAAARLREGIDGRRQLVFICTDPAGHEKTDHYARVDREWLSDIGIQFAQCDVLDDRVTPERAWELVRGASCLFLMGGQTMWQFRFMREYGLIEPIRESGAAVLGLSAGAINMAAIGLTGITVTPHYNARKDNLDIMNEIIAASYEHPLYAMCDGSAIFTRGDRMDLLGEIYKIDHGTIEGVSP